MTEVRVGKHAKDNWIIGLCVIGLILLIVTASMVGCVVHLHHYHHPIAWADEPVATSRPAIEDMFEGIE